MQADLATTEAVDRLYAAANGRPVDALLANAGRGLGKGVLDQDFEAARRVVDTNITGTIYLNKIQSAIANVTPADILAEQHRKMAEPGSGKQ